MLFSCSFHIHSYMKIQIVNYIEKTKDIIWVYVSLEKTKKLLIQRISAGSGFVGGSIEDKTFIMHVNQKILRVSSFIGPIVFNLKFFELDDFQPLGAKYILERVNFF